MECNYLSLYDRILGMQKVKGQNIYKTKAERYVKE